MTTCDYIENMNVGQVQKYWAQWQRSNAAESAKLMKQFTDMAIVRGFQRANAWLVVVIANKIGTSKKSVGRAIHELNRDD